MIKQWPVQQAVYSALAGDPTLFNMVTSISDKPPENAVHPYMVIGEDTGIKDDLLIETGSQQTVALHVWDKDAPGSRCKQIMDQTCVVMHGARLANPATSFISCEVI